MPVGFVGKELLLPCCAMASPRTAVLALSYRKLEAQNREMVKCPTLSCEWPLETLVYVARTTDEIDKDDQQ